MSVAVLHVCDKFGVRGSSIHGVSRLFSWWFPRYDRDRYQVFLCGIKQPEHHKTTAVTAKLSDTTRQDVAAALGLLLEVDGDVVRKYREFVDSGRAGGIKETVVRALHDGGKLFFTGCGSTGRLSIQLVSIWRDFWQRQRARHLKCLPPPEDFENRAFAIMAGGDFALIKSVEGFEDFTEFGK